VSPSRPAVRLRRPLRPTIRRGHPWIYDQALGPLALPPGTIATVVDHDGPIATAMIDPDGPIRARVLDLDPVARIDDAWVAGRAAAAAGRRRVPPGLAATDALRAIHGENDGLPGLTVDVYAGVAVVVFDGGAAAALWQPRWPAVRAGLVDGGVAVHATWTRGVRGARAAGHGDGAIPERIRIREGTAAFDVDVRHGQKTGFFLDQRANRARVAELAAGAEVLNLCAYTGGFSVRAGLAGAARVTSVDLAAPAIAAADRHWRLNGLAAAGHEGVVADAFAFLEDAVARGRRWDITIVDPPSFAASEAARPQALAAYQRLNRLALQATRPGGLLVSASCSSHVHEADLRAVLAEAGRTCGRDLRVVEVRGADADHPTLPAFPEGRYLQLLLAVT
jgi:23S rRNA (cytosine1962-C5)-methyltransferase